MSLDYYRRPLPEYDLYCIGSQGALKYHLLAKWLIYRYHHLQKKQIIDPFFWQALSYNKLTQQLLLDFHGRSKLKTQFFVVSKKYLSTIQSIVEETFHYPVVVKKLLLHRWVWVELISDSTTMSDYLLSCLEWSPAQASILVQEYYPATEDYRSVVIGGKVVGTFTRSNPESFKHNVAQGGKVTNRVLNDEQTALIETVVSVIQLDIAGVDFFVTPAGEIIFIEINDIPQYTWFEDATGKLFIKELLQYVSHRLQVTQQE